MASSCAKRGAIAEFLKSAMQAAGDVGVGGERVTICRKVMAKPYMLEAQPRGVEAEELAAAPASAPRTRCSGDKNTCSLLVLIFSAVEADKDPVTEDHDETRAQDKFASLRNMRRSPQNSCMESLLRPSHNTIFLCIRKCRA
jgi:hypothetical protein